MALLVSRFCLGLWYSWIWTLYLKACSPRHPTTAYKYPSPRVCETGLQCHSYPGQLHSQDVWAKHKDSWCLYRVSYWEGDPAPLTIISWVQRRTWNIVDTQQICAAEYMIIRIIKFRDLKSKELKIHRWISRVLHPLKEPLPCRRWKARISKRMYLNSTWAFHPQG